MDIVDMYLGALNLQHLKDSLLVVPPAKLEVLGTFPQQCFSFARFMAERSEAGFYVEGFIYVHPALAVGHAWFEEADGSAIDGTTADKSYVRVGVKVPVAEFQRRMSNPAFVKKFETYTELPFHRAGNELQG